MTAALPSGLGQAVASFGFDRKKTWPFMLMLLAMIAMGLGRIWTNGLAGEWGMAFLLVVLPTGALAMLLGELRLDGPVLVIGENGLLDRRRGPEFVPWPQIQEATIRRRSFNRGIRIVLCDGGRYDLELNLIAAAPAEVMRHIQERAAASAAGPSG